STVVVVGSTVVVVVAAEVTRATGGGGVGGTGGGGGAGGGGGPGVGGGAGGGCGGGGWCGWARARSPGAARPWSGPGRTARSGTRPVAAPGARSCSWATTTRCWRWGGPPPARR